MGALITALMVVQILSALVLIGLVMSQTTKSEGLTGTIGGKASSTFRGKPGIDDKLSALTRWCAVAFIVTSLLVWVVRTKTGV